MTDDNPETLPYGGFYERLEWAARSLDHEKCPESSKAIREAAALIRTLQSRIEPSDENVHKMALILSEIGLASDWEHATVNARSILTAIKDSK